MKTKKYIKDWEIFYDVTFVTGENDNIFDSKPTTHTATVYFDGVWFHCIMIDGKPANSLAYRSVKSAVKNAWIIRDLKEESNPAIKKYFLDNCTATVIDCSSDAVDFRIVELYDFDGNKVYSIQTTKKGRKAAELAKADAIHFRII